MIGAGIIGLPYFYYQYGVPFGLIVNAIIVALTVNSSYLYLMTKDLVGGYSSFSEIGFILFGRKSIFLISGLIMILCTGLLIVYYYLFSSICYTIIISLGFDSSNFFASQTFCLVWYGILNLTIIFKRTIKELKYIGRVNYYAAIFFIIVLVMNLFFEGSKNNRDDGI